MKYMGQSILFDHDIFYITLRDINGQRTTLTLEGESEVYDWAVNDMNDDDEILIIVVNGVCLYCALGTDRRLCKDDLTGFFG